jgi:hypothetical protein
VTRIARNEIVREVVRPGAVGQNSRPWRVLLDAPDTARFYFADGTTLQAVDLDTGANWWSMESSALPFQAVETNTVIADDPVRSQVVEINYRGVVLRSFPARVEDARTVAGLRGAFHGIEPQTHAIVEIQQPQYIETGWSAVFDIPTSFDEVRRRFAGFLLETR